MDYTAILDACIAGAATGTTTVAGKALAEKTRALFAAYASSQCNATPANPGAYNGTDVANLMSGIEKAAESNLPLAEALANWKEEANRHPRLVGPITMQSGRFLNRVKARSINSSTINQSNG